MSYKNIKGIVSRDWHTSFLVSIDRSEVPTHTKRVRLLLKFWFRVEFFDVRLGVVSLPCEWSWAIRLPTATVHYSGLMQMLFWRENFEDGHFPSPGLFAATYLEFPELSLISYVKPIDKILPLSPGLGQGKLITLRCENRNIQH
jgi:hypothetical protein